MTAPNTCKFCAGTGKIESGSAGRPAYDCPECHGKGWQSILERLELEREWRHAPQLKDEDEAESAALMVDAIAYIKGIHEAAKLLIGCLTHPNADHADYMDELRMLEAALAEQLNRGRTE